MGKGRAQLEGDSVAIEFHREERVHGLEGPGRRDLIPGAGEEDPSRRRGRGEQPKAGVEDRKGQWRGRAKTKRGRHGRQKKARAERSIRRSREVWSQLRSTPAARRPVTRAVVVGWIPTSSARGADLKTSLIQGSWRRYSCNRSSRGHIGTQAPSDAGHVFSLFPRRAARCARVEGNWRQTEKGTKGGSGGEAC